MKIYIPGYLAGGLEFENLSEIGFLTFEEAETYFPVKPDRWKLDGFDSKSFRYHYYQEPRIIGPHGGDPYIMVLDVPALDKYIELS